MDNIACWLMLLSKKYRNLSIFHVHEFYPERIFKEKKICGLR